MKDQPDRPTPRRARIAGVALAGAVLVTGAAACGEEEGSGDITTLTMTDIVDPEVSAITLIADLDVRVVVDRDQPQSGSLRIDDNLVDNTDIWVDDDGELFVSWSGYAIDVEPSEQPLLTVHVQRLEAVENRSDGNLTVVGLDAESFEVESSGDGHIQVQGRATSVEVDVTEDGTVDLDQLETSGDS